MKGFNHLFSYGKNNPLKYIDLYGLKCKLIYDDKSLLDSTSVDEIVYGETWHYDGFSQPLPRIFSMACWNKYWRKKTTFETTTEKYLIFKVWKCEEEVCGEKKIYKKTDIQRTTEIKKTFKDYERDYKFMEGTMITNDGYSIKGGNQCIGPAPF